MATTATALSSSTVAIAVAMRCRRGMVYVSIVEFILKEWADHGYSKIDGIEAITRFMF